MGRTSVALGDGLRVDGVGVVSLWSGLGCGEASDGEGDDGTHRDVDVGVDNGESW